MPAAGTQINSHRELLLDISEAIGQPIGNLVPQHVVIVAIGAECGAIAVHSFQVWMDSRSDTTIRLESSK